MTQVEHIDGRRRLLAIVHLPQLTQLNIDQEMVGPEFFYSFPEYKLTIKFSMSGIRGHRRRKLMGVVITALYHLFPSSAKGLAEESEIELYTYGHSIELRTSKGGKFKQKIELKLNGDLLADKPRLVCMLVAGFEQAFERLKVETRPPIQSHYDYMSSRAEKGLPVVPERVVCAACRLESGTIILGARHWDEQMHRTMAAINPLDDGEAAARADQGFYTNWQRYVDRKEGMIIARRENQIVRPEGTHDSDTLYSECLY